MITLTGGPAGVGNERGTVVGFVAVMVEMIGFTVGDNGDGRMVFGEAAVRFVGFGHQDVAFARVSAVQRGAVRALDKAADGVAWIGTGVHQNVGQHGAGGGFAVRSGHGDGSFAVHEQGEDVTAMHNALARRVCCDDFRIVRFDGAGVDHGLGLGDIFGSLPEFNGDAQRFKSVGFGAVRPRSEPSTATPSACSISARTLIPAPPIPMKWVAPRIRGAGRSIE